MIRVGDWVQVISSIWGNTFRKGSLVRVISIFPYGDISYLCEDGEGESFYLSDREFREIT